MCAAVRTPIYGLYSLASNPESCLEGLMNHFDEVTSAPQYFKNAGATFPTNATLIRPAPEVGIVYTAAKVSGNTSSK